MTEAMTRGRRRLAGLLLAGVMGLSVMAGPAAALGNDGSGALGSPPAEALATDSDHGWTYKEDCILGTSPYVHARWQGKAKIKGPGSGSVLTYISQTQTYVTVNVSGVYSGGYWYVNVMDYTDLNHGYIYGVLDKPGTYGYCGDGSGFADSDR